MRRNASRRDILKTTAKLALAGAVGVRLDAPAHAREGEVRAAALAQTDALLRAATERQQLPGVVAMAATDSGIFYEGVFGKRRLDGGAAVTRDTVFRVASMIKPITSVAALQLVEQGKLSLEAPVPNIDPELNAPRVLDGFDSAGAPQLRPAKRPITLRDLLTHTSGFSYRLWDAKALRYVNVLHRLPPAQRSKLPRTPLMFDPGKRWQYGPSLDWVGRIVEAVSGERLDSYFRRHIFDPLGMADTAFLISPQQRAREATMHRRAADGALIPQPTEKQVPRKTFSGGGGIYSTAGDYLTFIRMLLHGGALNGVRVLKTDTVAQMGRNQIGDIEAGILKTTAPALSNNVDFFPGISLRWGFGHMINMQPVPGGRSAGSLTWAGLFNTYYWIDPRQRVAAVFMVQVLPFADEIALRVYRGFERGVYAAVSAG
jgi:methyl acetate hydrolase